MNQIRNKLFYSTKQDPRNMGYHLQTSTVDNSPSYSKKSTKNHPSFRPQLIKLMKPQNHILLAKNFPYLQNKLAQLVCYPLKAKKRTCLQFQGTFNLYTLPLVMKCINSKSGLCRNKSLNTSQNLLSILSGINVSFMGVNLRRFKYPAILYFMGHINSPLLDWNVCKGEGKSRYHSWCLEQVGWMLIWKYLFQSISNTIPIIEAGAVKTGIGTKHGTNFQFLYGAKLPQETPKSISGYCMAVLPEYLVECILKYLWPDMESSSLCIEFKDNLTNLGNIKRRVTEASLCIKEVLMEFSFKEKKERKFAFCAALKNFLYCSSLHEIHTTGLFPWNLHTIQIKSQVELRMKLFVTCVNFKLKNQANIIISPANLFFCLFMTLILFFYVMIILRMWIKALLVRLHQFPNPSPLDLILPKPTQLSQTIKICSAAWLSTNLAVQFMISLQWEIWEKENLVWASWWRWTSQTPILQLNMSHSLCYVPPSLSSNPPRLLHQSLQNHNMLYTIKLIYPLGVMVKVENIDC
ncbi:hypothetical protein VP01_676g3 [Puccinia sorghi]|uniref:Uncharacterized protein n=1 Tax=Puccinia sorghi TaxID=27349 RepID=A0A0L6UEQ5_9BASI|nr:hypothetical protein VP01_676g3 [Puccinia sorghi]